MRWIAPKRLSFRRSVPFMRAGDDIAGAIETAPINPVAGAG